MPVFIIVTFGCVISVPNSCLYRIRKYTWGHKITYEKKGDQSKLFSLDYSFQIYLAFSYTYAYQLIWLSCEFIHLIQNLNGLFSPQPYVPFHFMFTGGEYWWKRVCWITSTWRSKVTCKRKLFVDSGICKMYMMVTVTFASAFQ